MATASTMSSRRRSTWRESRRVMGEEGLDRRPVTTALFEEYTVGVRRADGEGRVVGAASAGLRSYVGFGACDPATSASAPPASVLLTPTRLSCGMEVSVTAGDPGSAGGSLIQPRSSDSGTLNHRATAVTGVPLATEGMAHSTSCPGGATS